MSNAVAHTQLEPHHKAPELQVILGGGSDSLLHSTSNVVWIGSLIIFLQLLDGALTAIGISVYGIYAEGNPILRSLMSLIGFIPAIVLTKAICVGFTVYLCSQAKGMHWVSLALRCVAILYAFIAIIPWTLILASEYLS